MGGAGYIGSHMVRHLQDHDYKLIVLDDLSSGFADAVGPAELIVGDMGDTTLMDKLFSTRKIDAVMHFASFIQVGESAIHPGKYYENNVAKTIGLLNMMAKHDVKIFIFSSTAAIFGNPETHLIGEDHPQHPINPYGRTKWLVEQLLLDYETAYGIKHACLRYFNAAGAQPDGSLGERHDPETHLIPLVITSAKGTTAELKVFGDDYPTDDGTCVRDYVHVCDLADAHLKALLHLLGGGDSLKVNLGSGVGYSVKQIIEEVSQFLHRPIPHCILARRPGDPAVLVADPSRAANILGWIPKYGLNDIVAHAAAWHTSH